MRSFRTRARWDAARWLLATFALATFLVSGCGDDDDGDKNPTGPGGSNIVTLGLVQSVSDEMAVAFVLVLRDGQTVNDATVRINGANLATNQQGGYSGNIAAEPGDELTLTATSGTSTVTLRATVPAQVDLIAPADAAEFEDDDNIGVLWSATEDAERYFVFYYPDVDDETPLWEETTNTVLTIPSSETPSGSDGLIELYAANGEGAMLLTLDEDGPGTTSGFYAVTYEATNITVD